MPGTAQRLNVVCPSHSCNQSHLIRPSQGIGSGVSFGGGACAAYLTSDLPPSAWSSDPAAPFTAVWVGRLDGSSSGEQWLMGLVRRTGAGWTVRVCACKGRA